MLNRDLKKKLIRLGFIKVYAARKVIYASKQAHKFIKKILMALTKCKLLDNMKRVKTGRTFP